MDLNYGISNCVDVKSIGDLRNSVGWNSMTEFHSKSLCNSYFYICCYDNDKLVGFLDVVSNGSSDAYIQDVIVRPEYQFKGVGTTLMAMAIDKLKKNNIYAISVLFDERLSDFYKKFGFSVMCGGQIINEKIDL